MASPSGLPELLNHPAIWRGDSPAAVASVASGWAELDRRLPGGGWPRGALTELFSARGGIGELSLLAPALARLAADGAPQAWIAPPWLPYAPALAAAGIDLTQVLVVEPPAAAQTPWAIEECLRADGCGAVLAWPGRLPPTALRRLQLAAAASGACGFLFRGHGARQPSPAALRLELTPVTEGLRVDAFKVRGDKPFEVVIPL